MDKISRKGIFWGIVLLAEVLFFLWIFAYVGVTVKTDADCWEAGWARGTVAWNLKSYCIQEEHEYDIVPLETILTEQE